MKKFSDQKIIDSWQGNVLPWVRAIRDGEIVSRTQITNQAIIDVICQYVPKTVLDIGCGEGWLTRELDACGIATLGVDVVTEMIAAAEQTGAGRYRVLAYEDISASTLAEKFDLLVCNFSLLGKESVVQVFQQATDLLNPSGSLIVQTLHPEITCGDQAYVDGWREGSWAGFNDAFRDPAPWYFRTVESWLGLFDKHGFAVPGVIEPRVVANAPPVSIIFAGSIP